jgi:HTH-type transcriptional regulator / antitoxin HigA
MSPRTGGSRVFCPVTLVTTREKSKVRRSQKTSQAKAAGSGHYYPNACVTQMLVLATTGDLRYSRQPVPFDRQRGVPLQANLRQGISDPRWIQQRSLEEMAVTRINESVYRKLVAWALPQVIETEAECQRIIEELERLDTRGRPLSPEEERLAELLTLLVRQYEEFRYSLGHAEPIEALRFLMEQRELRQRDLIPVLGPSSVVSDVLSGKRSISKAQARKLAEFFHVGVGLFI